MPQQHCPAGLTSTGDPVHDCHASGTSRRSRRSTKSKSNIVNLVFPPTTDTDKQPSETSEVVRKPLIGKGKNRTAVGGKNISNDSQKEVSAIPDPVPDTGDDTPAPAPAAPAAPVHTSPLIQPGDPPSSAASAKENTNHRPLTASLQLFTPLPAFYSMVASTSSRDAARTSSASPTISVSSESSSPSTTKAISNVEQSDSNQPTPRHIPTVVIVLLILGGTCLIGAILVIIKIRNRPKKRWHPTPSLPILQDTYPNEKGTEDSPIFGGKERFSSRPGSNAVPWTWTQYHSGIPKPAATSQGVDTRSAAGGADSTTSAQRRLSRAGDDVRSGQDVKIQHATVATFVQPVEQHVQHAAARNTSRLSTVSLYPASIHPQAAAENIGIAVSSGNPNAAADGSVGLAHDRGKRWSTRRSTRDLDRRRTTLYEGTENGYLDAEASSPSLPTMPQGRQRIKAPYGAGSYLRTSTSTSMTKHVSTESNPFEEPAYAVPPMPYLPSEDRRDRNTKALTSALGLVSPPPPSPEPTLYPDDSLSIAGDRRHVGSVKKHAGQKVGSPGTEASAALGNLMLSDYRASKHIAVTSPDDKPNGEQSPRVRIRTDDKPPRVPSPPPMPSLAQMALAHTNPADFADYRSPTYSIYGLYDPDRTSRAGSGY
ncbi:hypothetical protein EVG20_g356 [Dentipellis fragilis]|uniref:Uncharacterized protein n=1 Tax=Dentipellis fragilis TaxID=205917 RepID=A0A4Y9ZGU8_9AGAM|nr:hypothetical protein EVG20_g356 [Dentipellis fragilis]